MKVGRIMTNPLKSTMRSEAVFSKDNKHRLLLKKVWNAKQPKATVITKFPNYNGVVKVDLTSQLIVNHLSDTHGGVYLMNLFTNIEINKNMEEVEDLITEESDQYLLQAIEDSEDVIIAWGSTSSKIFSERIKTVNQMLEAQPDKVRVLLNPETKQISHPLNPKSRSFWMVEKLDVRKGSQE